MPSAKLTKTFVDALPLSPDKVVFYRDTELLGFAVRVTLVKSYIAEKKIDGKTCRCTIGLHGVFTIQQAREKAREYLLLMSQRINPNKQKEEILSQIKQDDALSKLVPTLIVAYDFYKERKKLSPNTIKAYDICVNDYFKDWQDLQIDQITSKMILNRHLELSHRSPAQANLAIRFMRALFNNTLTRFKDDEGNRILDIKNPVAVIREEKAFNKIKRRKTYIRSDQCNTWAMGVVSTQWQGEQDNSYRAYTNQDYMLLLALTGFRRNEAETLKWSNIDLKFRTITVTDTKNGEDLTLPMGEILSKILNERKKLAINEYVFADRKGISHISDRRDARLKITEQTGISFTFHDLRRTFVSIANSLAIGSYTIKRLINHTFDDDHDVTGGYIQVSFDDMRKAMNMIEDVIIVDNVRKIILDRYKAVD